MRESTIEAARPASGALGIELSSDSPVKITKLLSSSCFLGKLFVGDIILAVNDHSFKKRDDFYKKAECAPTLKVKFERDEYCSCKINALPAPRKGFEAFDLELKWRKGGMPIGILVYQDIQKRVVVSVVESGSLAQDSIKAGDVVVKVNGVSVEDGKAGAKKLLEQELNVRSEAVSNLFLCETVGCPFALIVIPNAAGHSSRFLRGQDHLKLCRHGIKQFFEDNRAKQADAAGKMDLGQNVVSAGFIVRNNGFTGVIDFCKANNPTVEVVRNSLSLQFGEIQLFEGIGTLPSDDTLLESIAKNRRVFVVIVM